MKNKKSLRNCYESEEPKETWWLNVELDPRIGGKKKALVKKLINLNKIYNVDIVLTHVNLLVLTNVPR